MQICGAAFHVCAPRVDQRFDATGTARGRPHRPEDRRAGDAQPLQAEITPPVRSPSTSPLPKHPPTSDPTGRGGKEVLPTRN